MDERCTFERWYAKTYTTYTLRQIRYRRMKSWGYRDGTLLLAWMSWKVGLEKWKRIAVSAGGING